MRRLEIIAIYIPCSDCLCAVESTAVIKTEAPLGGSEYPVS